MLGSYLCMQKRQKNINMTSAKSYQNPMGIPIQSDYFFWNIKIMRIEMQENFQNIARGA